MCNFKACLVEDAFENRNIGVDFCKRRKKLGLVRILFQNMLHIQENN